MQHFDTIESAIKGFFCGGSALIENGKAITVYHSGFLSTYKAQALNAVRGHAKFMLHSEINAAMLFAQNFEGETVTHPVKVPGFKILKSKTQIGHQDVLSVILALQA